MSTQVSALHALKSHLRQLAGLNAATSLMYWDQATYLPEKGGSFRGDHLAQLASLSHSLETDPRIASWLNELESHPESHDPSSNDRALVRVVREDYERATRVPPALASAMSELASRSYEAWKKARAANDFTIVQDVLQQTVELRRQYAEHLKKPTHTSIMDPLVDLSDPGFTVANVRPLFEQLRAKLVPLLAAIAEQAPFNQDCLLQPIDERRQLAFGEKVILAIGYDFDRGRQDMTHHPFMIRMSHGDVRITTRCKERDFSEALFSTIHEAGHALYEQGIDESLEGTPLASGASSGIHESQSRLWENLVARGLPFWEHFFPKLQAEFPNEFGAVSLTTFHRAINRVQPGLIRTDADEVSYNLHVMIRFDLELALLEGKLSVADLPEAWNARYRQDLGLNPSSLSEGILQDVHWFHGALGGAFQSYTIGNILSAQLDAAARRALPDLDTKLRRGRIR